MIFPRFLSCFDCSLSNIRTVLIRTFIVVIRYFIANASFFLPLPLMEERILRIDQMQITVIKTILVRIVLVFNLLIVDMADYIIRLDEMQIANLFGQIGIAIDFEPVDEDRSDHEDDSNVEDVDDEEAGAEDTDNEEADDEEASDEDDSDYCDNDEEADDEDIDNEESDDEEAGDYSDDDEEADA